MNENGTVPIRADATVAGAAGTELKLSVYLVLRLEGDFVAILYAGTALPNAEEAFQTAARERQGKGSPRPVLLVRMRSGEKLAADPGADRIGQHLHEGR